MLSNGVFPFPGTEVSMMMVEVIRGVMGSPPEVDLIRILSNFVIAVHPPAGSFKKDFQFYLFSINCEIFSCVFDSVLLNVCLSHIFQITENPIESLPLKWRVLRHKIDRIIIVYFDTDCMIFLKTFNCYYLWISNYFLLRCDPIVKLFHLRFFIDHGNCLLLFLRYFCRSLRCQFLLQSGKP